VDHLWNSMFVQRWRNKQNPKWIKHLQLFLFLDHDEQKMNHECYSKFDPIYKWKYKAKSISTKLLSCHLFFSWFYLSLNDEKSFQTICRWYLRVQVLPRMHNHTEIRDYLVWRRIKHQIRRRLIRWVTHGNNLLDELFESKQNETHEILLFCLIISK